MPEPRARVYHRNRVAQSFTEEIGAMLEGELSDPRLYPAVVSEVLLAPGGKAARIFITVTGGEEAETSTLEALTAARGFIRSSLRDRLGVRHVPELNFSIDRSERLTGRVDELLDRSRKRDAKRHPTEATVPRQSDLTD